MAVAAPGLILLPATPITAAVTGVTTGSMGGATGYITPDNVDGLIAQCVFTYGSGGTTANAYLQTSLDGGVTWIDIANFSFTTASATKISSVVALVSAAATAPTDGALTANTVANGIIGDRFRVKYTTTGTYVGTTMQVVVMFIESGRV